MNKEKNGLGIASLVLGISSITFWWVPFLGLASGIIGIVCSAKQRKSHSNGIATGGLVTSIIGVVISAIYNFLILIGILFAVGSVAS